MIGQSNSPRAPKKAFLHAGTALAAILLSAACSHGDGQSLPSAPPAPAPTPAPNKTTQSQPPGGRQGPTGQPGQPGAPGAAPQAPQGDGDPSSTSQEFRIDNPTPDSGKGASAPAPVAPPSGPAQSAGPVEGQVVMDPSGLTPDQIFDSSTRQGPAFKGVKSATAGQGEPLFYTGAAQDFLHEQIAQQIASETGAQLARDRKFASEIGMATFEYDAAKREAKFSVDVTVNGRKTNRNFVGQLNNQMRLRTGSTQNAGDIAVEATCLDLSGGCHTVHVRLLTKANGGKATAHVIARLSNAYIYIEGNPPGASQNQEYDNLMNLLLNTVTNPNGPDSVQSLGFYTSEVIGGKSNFAILMRLGVQDVNKPRGDAQVMAMMGALVKPANTMDENFLIPPPPTVPTIVGGRTFLLPTEIANTIRDVRVVKNDGRGNMQFDITVRKSTPASSEDTIRLTVARLQEPVRDLSQEEP